ncbi:arginine decarboxylase, partial [Methanosarcinales archaeon]
VVQVVRLWRIEDSAELYGISCWGSGYFGISKNGNLTIATKKDSPYRIEIVDIVRKLNEMNLKPPFLLRFPQLLHERLKDVHGSFVRSIGESGYGGAYHSVFPVKVNQRREVIEGLLHPGLPLIFGLEVGSKPELLLAIPYQAQYDVHLLCNGCKDDAYITLALKTIQFNKNTIIVIDDVSETGLIIDTAKELDVVPQIGIRTKLYSKGSGKWESSGGDTSKFGLNTTEILEVIKTLGNNEMLSSLNMLHFHIGSQVTAVSHIQKAVEEAARIYVKLHTMGANIQYFNIGGGLGVNYDSSKTSSSSSTNYTLQEYANNVVSTLKTICDEENAPHPTIISESGRAIAAYHSMLIINISGRKNMKQYGEVTLSEKDASIVRELYDCYHNINIKNYEEYYPAAVELKEELINLFNLGQLGLEEKSKGETLFWKICQCVASFASKEDNTSEQICQLEKHLSNKYLGNFSIFQSIPDSWAIDQLFPILPIHRLNEKPACKGTIIDLTCDSDGEINQFIDQTHTKELLELHPPNQDPYYLAITLIGAYQDTMGDCHNLFGAVNEVHITQKNNDNWHIKHIIPADTTANVLNNMKYETTELLKTLNKALEERKQTNETENFINLYEKELGKHTYLNLHNFVVQNCTLRCAEINSRLRKHCTTSLYRVTGNC